MQRNIVAVSLFALIVILALLELRVQFIEVILGFSLEQMNEQRKPWGTYWERDELARDAEKQIESENAESIRLKRKAEESNDLGELLSLVPTGYGLPVSPQKFSEIYLTFPSDLRHAIITDNELVDLLIGKQWQRTSIWLRNDAYEIYMVDESNRLIKTLRVPILLVEFSNKIGKSITGKLSDDNYFKSRLFNGELFLETLTKLSSEERDELFKNAQMLLSIPTPLTNVGFFVMDYDSEIAFAAFETVTTSGYVYVIHSMSLDTMNRLIWLMDWDSSDYYVE